MRHIVTSCSPSQLLHFSLNQIFTYAKMLFTLYIKYILFLYLYYIYYIFLKPANTVSNIFTFHTAKKYYRISFYTKRN